MLENTNLFIIAAVAAGLVVCKIKHTGHGGWLWLGYYLWVKTKDGQEHFCRRPAVFNKKRGKNSKKIIITTCKDFI